MADHPAATGGSRLASLKKRWRLYLRSLHRDVGYLLVGLTVIYAVSGVAINHIDDWNPNFDARERTVELSEPLPADTQAAVAVILRELDIAAEPSQVNDYGAELEISFGEHRNVRADRDSGQVFEDYQEPRFFLRVANWLHYNRGKAAWTYIADGYALLLLFLALSGTLLIKGRKGLWGRGLVLIALGALVPILYVQLSGGP